METMVFSFPGNETLSNNLLGQLNAERGEFVSRRFPDGESYLRVLSAVEGKEALIICSLDHPDEKILPLIFLCSELRDLKIKKISLLAPYLAYMRQDKRFQPGEALSSTYFAGLLSAHVDALITIDPHLHRRLSMNEIYSIPCEVLHANGCIAEWIRTNVGDALLVGPDSESEQWVAEVARLAGRPFTVLQKIRRGDREVEVSMPEVEKYKDLTPVMVDDIISTARTMIETVQHLKQLGMKAPVCIGIHAVFAGKAYQELLDAGAGQVVTCNTIQHPSNGIDVSGVIRGILNDKRPC